MLDSVYLRWPIALLVLEWSAGPWVELVALVALVAGVLGFAWREKELQPNPGDCPTCGYDLTGLDDGAVCPECGETG